MVDEGLAAPCTNDVGVAGSIGALWSVGGGAWVVCVAVCCGCLVGGNLFYSWGYTAAYLNKDFIHL